MTFECKITQPNPVCPTPLWSLYLKRHFNSIYDEKSGGLKTEMVSLNLSLSLTHTHAHTHTQTHTLNQSLSYTDSLNYTNRRTSTTLSLSLSPSLSLSRSIRHTHTHTHTIFFTLTHTHTHTHTPIHTHTSSNLGNAVFSPKSKGLFSSHLPLHRPYNSRIFFIKTFSKPFPVCCFSKLGDNYS